MRTLLLAFSLALLAGCAHQWNGPGWFGSGAWSYPPAHTVDHVDRYGETEVADPYRWLEELDGADTRAWIEAQNRLTQTYLAQVKERPRIHARMTALWNFERFGLPSKEGGRYLVARNDGLQNQSVLYLMDSLDGEMQLALDPNLFSEDGTVALSGTAMAPNGRYLAYGISSGGSDWQEWRIRDLETGEDLPERIEWVKFSRAQFSRDGSGFYYSRYDAPDGEDKLKAVNENQKVYFHRLGEPQSSDRLVYERPDQPRWGLSARESEDGRYLLINVSQGTDRRNRFFYRDLDHPAEPVVELISELEATYQFIGNDGPLFWFRTNQAAPRHRVIAIDIRRPQRENWQEVIAESDATLVGASHVGGVFIAEYLRDARAEVKRYSSTGEFLGEVALPGIGAVSGFNGKAGDSETFFSFTSFTTPAEVWRLDTATGETSLFRRPISGFDASRYETTQVFYTSKDGTRVPMFVTARKDLPRNGKQATLLYGYGGFNIPMLPGFSVPVATWLEMGGVYAVANLRGGGEYGEAWHRAGTKLEKQNVFDDFIAAAEYLIEQRYTRPDRLAIHGRSNGGLLAAAALLQRPDLFAASVPGVGVLDMLRFNRFTIGWAWESDYGSPQDPEQFQALYAYSPLHNIRPGQRYPATLVTTGDHDDRVFPAHSFKFTAAQQALAAGPGPYLTRIETRAGHGAGKPTAMQIDEWSDVLAFLHRELGM